jgi:hypothetical protein
MVMLMDKSCFALFAQILPCCCFVAALSLPSPLVRAVSEEGSLGQGAALAHRVIASTNLFILNFPLKTL